MAKKATGGGDRLMTLPELANYLHLGEKTVLKLAVANKIPGLIIDKQWRFKRATIDTWLEQQLTGESEDFAEIPDGMKVPIGDLLPDEAIISDLAATDAFSVIEELAARAYSNSWLNDKPWFVGAVVERESLASTAMEGGVAFLHTRAKDMGKIARPFIICGRSYDGIDFGAPDARPTHLFFLLGLKYDRLHLPILGRLARALRNPATIAKLRAQPSAAKIRALLIKEDQRALTTKREAPIQYKEVKPPGFDKQTRLRAIMRLQAQRRHEDKKTAKSGKATKSKTAAAKTARAKAPAKAPVSKASASKSKSTASKAKSKTSTRTTKKS